MTSGNPFSVFHKKLVFKISINMAAYKGPQSIDIFIKKNFILLLHHFINPHNETKK